MTDLSLASRAPSPSPVRTMPPVPPTPPVPPSPPVTVPPRSQAEESAAPKVRIAVHHLDAYYGAARTVRDVNIAFNDGQVTAIIGPSGCGKSTLLRCLNRMHETVPGARTEGEVLQIGRAHV